LFVVFAGKKQPKHFGKAPEIKKNQVRSDDKIYSKNFGKMYKFLSLGLELQVSNLGVLDEVSVSS